MCGHVDTGHVEVFRWIFYSGYYQTKLTALASEPLTPLRNADRQLFLDQLQCSMTTSFCFCACGNTIRSRFHYFSMAFVRVHLCVCVCAHALNLMKGIFCSSQSQVIFFFHTHTHTQIILLSLCVCSQGYYLHGSDGSTQKTTYVCIHTLMFVDVLIWAHRASLLKHLCTRTVPRLPVVHPSKSFSLSPACENIHCSQPMRWLFQDHGRTVWKDQVNTPHSFLQILYFKWTTQLLNRTCLCFRSLGQPLWIPTEKSVVMKSAFRNPASPTTVETPLTSMLQWQISSHIQTTASPCWPVPRAVATWEDVLKVCPLQLPHYPQSLKVSAHCLWWPSVSLF